METIFRVVRWGALLFLLIPFYAAGQVTANFSGNPLSGCSPVVVNFTDLSTGPVTTWSWNFGNGNTSTLQNPSAVYVTPGTYTVTLTVTDGGANSDTETKVAYITVFQNPTSNFAATTPTGGCIPHNVCFADSSIIGDAPINQWLWDFGDGTNSTAQNPCHTFTTPGNFTITLVVTDTNGCQATLVIPNMVNASSVPIPDFNASPLNACDPPLTVNFTNTSTGGAGTLTYKWFFGDGDSSTAVNPTHTYTAAGSYTVTLIATDQNNCSDTIVVPSLINITKPTANFSHAPDTICEGESVTFTDLSTNGAVSWAWDFGDGGTSSAQNPSYAYNTAGDYDVTLIVQNANGCPDTMTVLNAVHVDPLPDPQFMGDTLTSCEVPFTVNFTDTSQGAISWLWDFGDGNTSTAQNPTNIYTAPGTYTVSLTITDTNGCQNTLTKTNYVQIVPPVANFSGNPTQGCVPLSVNFNDLSTSNEPIVSWQWDFGDGNTSTAQNPTNIYTNPGTYTVTLIIVNAAGCTDTLENLDMIQAGILPTAIFSATPLQACIGDTVFFTDSSLNATAWLYDFGDGGTSTQQNPAYVYQDTGCHTVTLTVLNNGCQDDTIIDNYVCIGPPLAMFTLDAPNGCTIPHTVNFADSSLDPDTWFWDFGDGNTSTQQNPSHTYMANGTYTVMLIVQDTVFGCVDTAFATVSISAPLAGFFHAPDSGCAPLTVQFTDTSTGAFAYSWTFGGGGTSSAQNPSNTFTNPGTYDVTLAIVDSNGCTDTVTKTNIITATGPAVNFAADTISGCLPLTVNFSDSTTGQGPFQSWLWDFGDGNTSTQQNPTHTYNVTGTFTVSLTVMDADSCTQPVTFTNYISVTNPLALFTVNDTLGCLGVPVSFGNQSQGVTKSYFWDFGDGNTDNVPFPTHTYDSTGVFDITLIVCDQNGCTDTLVDSAAIDIQEVIAGFIPSATSASCPPLLVNFTDTSQFNIVSWEWDFGDGTGSVLQNPSHVFATAGSYDITLIVENNDGCRDTLFEQALINIAGPNGSFVFEPDTGCTPQLVKFNATATNTVLYTWDFGDGTVASTTADSVQHTYTQVGTFHPVLILDDGIGCTFTVVHPDSIEIDTIPFPDFSISTNLICGAIQPVTFTDQTFSTQPITDWFWDFGDGNTSTQQNPTHLYAAPGKYDVTLTVINLFGCTDSITKPGELDIVVPPVAIIDMSDTLGCLPLGVQFGDSSIKPNPIASTTWNFGDGSPLDTTSHPFHLYTATGFFDVTLTLTDTFGCVDSTTETLEVRPGPTANFTASPTPGCPPTPHIFVADSGMGIVTYNWLFGDGGGGFGNPTQYTYAAPGTYTVRLIVTDTLGCADTLVQPNLINIPAVDSLWTHIIPYHVNCNGGSDGHNDLVITGGLQPYTVLWSTGAGTEDVFGLSAGSYTVTVTDSLGCVRQDSVTLTEPSPVVITTAVQDAACNGDSTGMAWASATGGHGNYEYTWAFGSQVNDTAIGLPANTHAVLVTDTSYGPNFHTIFFEDFDGVAPWKLNVASGPLGSEPNVWEISDDEGANSPPNCALQNNGNATLHITDPNNAAGGAIYEKGGNCGTGPCPETNFRAESPAISTIGWSNLTLYFDAIANGDGMLDNFSVWYNDGFGWNPLVVSVKTPTCGIGQGQWSSVSAALPASCDNIPDLKIGFNWTNNDDGIGSDPSVAINDVRIDAPNTDPPVVCNWPATAVVGEPTPLNLQLSMNAVLCNGGSDGTASSTLSGGHGAYSFEWTPGGNTFQNISGLSAGTYTMTATDTAITIADPLGYILCEAVDSIVVPEPLPLVLTMSTTSTSCWGGQDGTASVSVSGGTPPYAYLWNNGQTGSTATGLGFGTYIVVVKDANGCLDTNSIEVPEPPPIITSTTKTDVTCPLGTDGTATVNVSGGTPGYTFSWNSVPPQTSQTATNLPLGFYTVNITDANNCTASDNVLLLQPPLFTATTSVVDVVCGGDSTGSISVLTSNGGTGPHTYAWAPGGQTGSVLSNMPAGAYFLQVTDSIGCFELFPDTIKEPAPMTFTVQTTPNSCAVGTNVGSAVVTVNGGTPPYTYFWNTNPIATTPTVANLATGSYVCTITDANGCLDTVQAHVNYVPGPTVTAGPNVSACETNGGTGIFATGTGGTQQYYYTWWCDTTNTWCGLDSVHDNDPNANPTVTTWYYVQIVDANGCKSNIDSLLFTVLPKPIVDAGPDIYLCGDSAPCQLLQATVTGAPGPFTYQWTPSVGLNSDTILQPCARPDTTTMYTLVAHSINGCKSNSTTVDTNSTVTVHVNPIPIADAGPDIDICFGDSVKLKGIGTGAGPTYHYQWTPNQFLTADTVASPFAFPPFTTSYFLTVWSNKCPSYSDTMTINVHTIPTVDAGPDRHICLNDTALLDGQASGDSTSPTYSYAWFPNSGVIGDTTNDDLMASPPSTLTYYMYATSIWGCQSPLDSATVYIKPMPWAEAGPNKVICVGDSTILEGSWFYTTTDTVPNSDTSQINPFWLTSPVTKDTIWQPYATTPTTQYYYLRVEYHDCYSYDSVLVTVYPELTANVDADTTTICGTDSVQLYSWGGFGNAHFSWAPNGGIADPDSANTMVAPSDTTTYQLVIQEGFCTDTAEITINVIPRPDLDYISSFRQGCVPHEVSFLEIGDPAFSYEWDFGDGSPLNNQQNPTHTYLEPGVYTVTLIASNVGRCTSMVDYMRIRVEDTASVDFTSDPVYPVTMILPETEVDFIELTDKAVSWDWNFGDGATSSHRNPTYRFPTAGTFFVTLYATNDFGCVSQVTHGPYIITPPELFIPNIFSPNGDGNNDRWRPDYNGTRPYSMQIHDRWGVKLFETKNKLEGWDGNVPGGAAASEGVYYYTVFVGEKKFAGHLTLIR